MQDKQKVTLYLPPEIHRQLKIRAAVEIDSMSAMVERAIVFYLRHPEVVDEVEAAYGKNYQVYGCPECSSSLVIKDGEMVSLKHQASILDEELSVEKVRVEKVREEVNSVTNEEEEQLVPC